MRRSLAHPRARPLVWWLTSLLLSWPVGAPHAIISIRLSSAASAAAAAAAASAIAAADTAANGEVSTVMGPDRPNTCADPGKGEVRAGSTARDM